jgi:hypothetical protein
MFGGHGNDPEDAEIRPRIDKNGNGKLDVILLRGRWVD